MNFNQELPNSTKRVIKEKEALQKLWELYHEKLSNLRHALATETDVARKFQFKEQIKEVEQEIEKVKTKLGDIENQLDTSNLTPQQAGLRDSHNEETPVEFPNREIPEIDQNIRQVEAELKRIIQPARISDRGSYVKALINKLNTSKKKLITFIVLVLCGGVGAVLLFIIHNNIPNPEEVCKLPAADVSGIDFSLNGEYLATASLDKTVRILKVKVAEKNTDQTDSVDCKLDSDGVVAVKFSPDGQYLATASFDSAHLWKVNNDGKITPHKLPIEHRTEQKYNGELYKNAIVAIDFSQDAKYLATASSDGTINVWNVETLEKHFQLKPPTDIKTYILSVNFSSDGNYITATDINGIGYVWQLKEGNGSSELRPQASIPNVTDSKFSVNDKYLATASADGTVSLREIPNFQKPIFNFNQSNTYIINVTFSPRGKYITAISLDKKAYIWDLQTKTRIKLPEDISNVAAIAFSLDEEYLAIANNNTDPRTVTVWKTTSLEKIYGEEIYSFTPAGNGLVTAVDFSPISKNGVYLAIVTSDSSIDIRKLN